MRDTSEEIPRIGLISRAQFLLLLCGSLSLLCGCAGFTSSGIIRELAVEDHFQISDVVFAGKVLRMEKTEQVKSRYNKNSSGLQSEIVIQGESYMQDERRACGPREPTALEQLNEIFNSIPWHYSGGVSEPMWSGTLKVEFEVYEIWKGKTSKNLTVLTQCYTESCGYTFKVGSTHVMFACYEETHADEASNAKEYLWTDLYWANKNLDDSPEAKSVIKQLNVLKSNLLQDNSVGGDSQDLSPFNDSSRLE